ncbi:citrate synthase [Devosia limi DSM 17137]|uniref:Citrate synthase n=1 Tax=Devosia limi DSM 17137 TaxID=1121477 RepID=A0A0F5LU11_9HYPH|nr:citrate synthase [Devosia limi]KKB85634.1 citrate synthase [Devosia limi DSM 17137]SHF90847.1 citrate synthase [Devosia limi DSM 17137]
MGWVTAEAALARLGTKPQTLYANVSRGRIAAKPDPADPRRSLYSSEDVERLAARQRGRRKAETVAAQSIAWGDPVLNTAISTVIDGRLFYRGEDAAALSRHADLETVAALLWQSGPVIFQSIAIPASGEGITPAFIALAQLAATDMPSLERSPAVLHREAARVVGAVGAAVTGRQSGPLHERLAMHWQRPEAADMLRRALVLLAEHELNASTFATRVAASTGASLAAAVLAGLATLSGPRHGGAAAAMQDLVVVAERLGPEGAARSYLAQGRALPCFGHRLYPDGDVRGLELMQHFALPPLYQGLSAAGETAVGERPNIDFALAALAAAFDLPQTAPLTLFALGRTIGWLAHALEQAESGALIRPRAHYVGPAPIG